MKWLFYCGVLLVAVVLTTLRFLLGTLWGIFFLSVGCYVAARLFTNIDVFNLQRLVAWFADLSEGAQVAVSAGVLTTLGLVAAYWTALAAWKKQKEIELRLATADDIQTRFQVALRCCQDISAYLSVTSDSVSRAQALSEPAEKASELAYANSQADLFEPRKMALHETRMAMHGLFATHSSILTNTFGVFEKIRAVNELIDEACEACAFIAPRGDWNSPNFVAQFVGRYNEQRTRNAIRRLDRVTNEGAGAIGFVNGRLRQDVLIPTVHGVVMLFRQPALLAGAIDRIRKLKPQKKMSLED